MEENVETNSNETNKSGNKLLGDIVEIIESTLITVFVIVMIFYLYSAPCKRCGNFNDKYTSG